MIGKLIKPDSRRVTTLLLLRQLMRRIPAAPATVPTQAQLEELRAELRVAERRRDAVLQGALLLLGGMIWLGIDAAVPWLGWAILAAGLARLASGLWR